MPMSGTCVAVQSTLNPQMCILYNMLVTNGAYLPIASLAVAYKSRSTPTCGYDNQELTSSPLRSISSTTTTTTTTTTSEWEIVSWWRGLYTDMHHTSEQYVHCMAEFTFGFVDNLDFVMGLNCSHCCILSSLSFASLWEIRHNNKTQNIYDMKGVVLEIKLRTLKNGVPPERRPSEVPLSNHHIMTMCTSAVLNAILWFLMLAYTYIILSGHWIKSCPIMDVWISIKIKHPLL